MYKASQLHEFQNLFIYIFFFSVEKLRKRNGEHMTYIYTNKITFIVVFCKFVEIIKYLLVKAGLQ